MKIRQFSHFLSVLLLFLFITLIYSFAVYTSPSIREKHLTKEAYQGKLLFQKYNCIACHQIYGLGGYMGPDLTNITSKRDTQVIYTFIKYGTQRMPNLHLSDQEIHSIIAFLKAVDQTGIFPNPPVEFHWSGSYFLNYSQNFMNSNHESK